MCAVPPKRPEPARGRSTVRGMPEAMRVATWNVNNRGRSVAQTLGHLVRRSGVDLLLLQEANPGSLHLLAVSAGLDWWVTSLDAGGLPPSGSPGRRRVAAIAGRGARPSAGVLAHLALPERMVFASLDASIGRVTVAS